MVVIDELAAFSGAAATQDRSGSTTFLPPTQYLQLPRSPDAWLIDGVVPVGGLVNLYAPPKAGKSFLALQLAIDLAQGASEWLGFPIRKSGPVAYLQLDTPRSLWAERLEAVQRSGLDVSNIYIADSEQAPYPFDILDPDHGFAWLAQQVDAIKPVLVIIDTIREMHGGDENDSGQMKQVVSAVVAATRPAACLLVSHSRKSNPERGEDLMGDNRGSSYVAGRMDTILYLTQKALTYQGRAVDKNRLPLRRLEGGFWRVGVDEEDAIKRVLGDAQLHSLNERADALGELIGKSSMACRSLLRRRMGASAEQLTAVAGVTAAVN